MSEPFIASKAAGGATRDAAAVGVPAVGIAWLSGQLGVDMPPEIAAALATVLVFAWRALRAWWKHGDVVRF